jgi:hypothetical protein
MPSASHQWANSPNARTDTVGGVPTVTRIAARGRPVFFLLLITIVGVAIVPLAAPPGGTADPANYSFAEFMEPRLTVLLGSSREVERLVSTRSRNILALRAESERMDAIIEQIDAFVEERELTADQQVVVDRYRAGTTQMQTAISAAFEAISRFDFTGIPAMIPVFSEGARQIESALDTLRTEKGTGSSYTGLTAT